MDSSDIRNGFMALTNETGTIVINMKHIVQIEKDANSDNAVLTLTTKRKDGWHVQINVSDKYQDILYYMGFSHYADKYKSLEKFQ